MATTGTTGPPEWLTGGSVDRRRRLVNRAATVGMGLALLVALVPLAAVTYFLISKGASVVSGSFLTGDIPRQYRKDGGGMGPAIVGTLVITGTAALLAIPLGVLGAIYLNEYGRQRPLARLIRTMADVMTGVPSIVMGLFIYVVWVLRTGEQSAFAGALALACLMLPIVIRTSEETLKLVPDELRQASLGLGAPRWRTILTVVLPAGLSGITSGAMLAVARAAGETAPLIATVGLTFRANWNLNGQNTALSAQIFRNATQPFEGAQDRAWGAALTLVAIVFILTLLARAVASRFTLASR
jgi:phosphate transport system permease protein